MQNQIIHVRITTASPLHIGCDEVYEPMSFVVDKESKELVTFATLSLLECLDSDALKKFSSICRTGTVVSLLELLKFMRSQSFLADGTRIPVPDSFVAHYEDTLNLPVNDKEKVQQELNNFQINRTAFDPMTGRPYLPGSTVKGAIRTAVLNLRHRNSPVPKKDYSKMRPWDVAQEARNLERKIVGGQFETDPFRLLKVSDFFPIFGAGRRIVYAVNRKKKQSPKESQAPYQIFEVVDAGAEFIGTITVLEPIGTKSGIKRPVSRDEISLALKSFYGDEKQREDKELAGIGIKPVTLVINDTSLPLRLGRHSGAECVTVNGHRSICIMQGNGKYKHKDHATTVWGAADSKKPVSNQGISPFGWVRFEPLSAEEGQRKRNESEGLRADIMTRLEENDLARKQREKGSRIQLVEQKKKEAEEAARLAKEQAEEQAVKEQWEGMAEYEQQLSIIRKDELALRYAKEKAHDPITHIWYKIDEMEPKQQKVMARAFMERWKNEGRWKVKKKSNKQIGRVKKVKKILGQD